MNIHNTEKADSYKIFNRIHKRYDFLNRVFSFGQDIFWRYKVSQRIDKTDNQLLLDLASGTGDVAFSLLKHAPQISHAYGLDMAQNMLDTAAKKASRKKLIPKISFLKGDASSLPIPDESMNITTMAFGIRNVPDPLMVLNEMKRVLKPSGKTLILEFSLPQNPILKILHLFYLRFIIPPIGALISQDRFAYRYLNLTIESFPYGKAFCELMKEAGFKKVVYTPLTFGVVTLYQGEK